MRKENDRVDVRLKQIKREFSLHRRGGENKGKGYPPRLQALAMAGVTAGIPGAEVAEAAGVSAQCILNWRKQASSAVTTAPRELSIVEGDDTSAATPTIAANQLVTIQFRSGIRVELSQVALTTELMARLNEVSR